MAKIDFEKMAQDVARKAVQELRDNGVFAGSWIPVSERLPEEDGSYLACTDDGYIATLRFNRTMELGWLLNAHVIAWMPLPEPPKTKQKAYKEFKIGEKIPPEEWQKGRSVTEIIDEVRERMCKKYCKYPYEWDEETQGELSESEICEKCPLNRL